MQGDLQYAGLFSKVRALYAKRLKAEDYRRLSNMRSLSDAVTYLKRFPGWADILSSVDEFNIRRGYLESVIKRAYFQEQERLLHFIPRKDRPLMEFSIPRYEIELILSFLRFFTLGHLEDFSTDLPPSFSKFSDIDLSALQGAKTYGEMLSSVSKTQYFGALSRLSPKDDRPLDYNTIELVLWQIYYDRLFTFINKNYSGETKAVLLDLLASRVDMENISRVLRIKTHFHIPSESLFDYLIHSNYKIDDSFLRALYETSGEEDMQTLLSQSKYRKVFRRLDLSEIRANSFDYLVAMCRRMILRSPPTVCLGVVYQLLKEAEIVNLVRIIESIRYSVAPENILLI